MFFLPVLQGRTGDAPKGKVLSLVDEKCGRAWRTIIPNISLSTEEQTNANGAVAQLGNFGSTLGPPVFSYFLVFMEKTV
jgi:hypothetical protein